MIRTLTAALLAGAAVAGCASPFADRSLATYHPALGQDREYFTRVGLRSDDGVFLRSSNLLALRQMVPIGSPARITRFSEDEVDIIINSVHHTMFPVGGAFDTSERGVEDFIDKYFVSAREDAVPEKLGPPELAAPIHQGRVLKGMTKEQVYAALGPPQWIDEIGETAVTASRARILRSDRWVYTDAVIGGVVPQKVAYSFEGNRLQDIVQ